MIDFDGVLADLDSAFVHAVNDKFDENYAVEDVTDWQFWRTQDKEIGEYVWGTLFNDADWMLENVKPYEGASEALYDLISGFDTQRVAIVTARQRHHQARVQAWLWDCLDHDSDLLKFFKVEVVAVGKQPKVEVCKQYGLTHIVDDGPHNLSPFNPLKTSLYLVNRPHNAAYPNRPYLNRVDSLQDAVDHAYGGVAI